MAFIVFVYSFDDGKWLEAEQLFLHDIALLLDRDKKEAYFWTGSRAKESEIEVAFQKANTMMNKFKLYEFVALGESTIPLKVQKEIDVLLGDNADPSKIKVERTTSMQLFYVFGILGILSSLALLINNLRMLSWSTPEYYETSPKSFNSLFEISSIIGLVVLGLFLIQFISSIFSGKIFLMVCSLTSWAIMVGTFFYLAEGELIFNFVPSFDENLYLIERSAMTKHILWVVFAFLVSSMVNIISIIIVFKQSEIVEDEGMDISEMERKSKPS